MREEKTMNTRPACHRTVLGVAAIAAAAALTSAADNARTIVAQRADGTDVITTITPAHDPADAVDFVRPRPLDDGEVLWHQNLADAIFTSSRLAMTPEVVFAGTWLNPPREAQYIPFIGDGTPDWTQAGTSEVYVDASRDGSTLAAIDYDGSSACTVYKWSPGNSTPEWSYVINGARPGANNPVAISADGSTIAILVTDAATTTATLYWFDQASNVPLGIYTGDTGYFGRNLVISDNGAYMAFIGLAYGYVVERDTANVRFSQSMGATNDPIAISGDGQYLVYGWSTLYCRQWDGSQYSIIWTRPGGSGKYLSQIALSDANGVLATTWTSSGSRLITVDLHDVTSSTPIWTYQYDLASGSYQEIAMDVDITHDGSYFAIASMGDEFNTNDEVHVFSSAASAPIATLDTPGSMFDVDIALGDDDALYVAACGKNVHANESGRGGDRYLVRIPLGSSPEGDLNGDGCVDLADLGILLASYEIDAGGDLDGDGDTDLSDLGILLANWGAGC
jgi:hypothetical protein